MALGITLLSQLKEESALNINSALPSLMGEGEGENGVLVI
jgi:hypothetical protein